MNSPEKIKKETKHLVLYFQVHQPERLQPVNFFDLAGSPHYFNDDLNRSIMQRIAKECYLPANKLLLELITDYPNIKVAFSMTGVVLEQLQRYVPDVLKSFQQLAKTGKVEFLGETYYHSLASLVNTEEFEVQVLQHAEKIYEVFGVRPTVFRNTELIYNDVIGRRVAMLGYGGIITEGHEKVLCGKTPHALYHHPEQSQLKIFLRNYRLSDDIAFRFMEGGSRLKVSQYMQWLDGIPQSENLITLAMDYETFGEHHKRESGIFDFLRGFLATVAVSDHYAMTLPSEAISKFDAAAPLCVPEYLSWADLERDLSAWLGNDMQRDAFNSVMKLESEVIHLKNRRLQNYWRYLQTSDHFYYMSLKSDSDGSVHSYFSPFPSSYEAFINYMNVLTHLSHLITAEKLQSVGDDHDLSSREAERQQVRTTTPVWAMKLESVPHSNVPEVHD